VEEGALVERVVEEEGVVPSLNHARRVEKERRRERGRMRGQAAVV
jgi:hypothetical protein